MRVTFNHVMPNLQHGQVLVRILYDARMPFDVTPYEDGRMCFTVDGSRTDELLKLVARAEEVITAIERWALQPNQMDLEWEARMDRWIREAEERATKGAL
jgi:hypothetical protein